GGSSRRWRGPRIRPRPGHRPAAATSLRVAELAQGPLVIGPAATYLDPGLQEHPAIEQRLHGHARLAGHFAQALALLADDDGLLPLAFHPDHGVDAAQASLGNELLDFHGGG